MFIAQQVAEERDRQVAANQDHAAEAEANAESDRQVVVEDHVVVARKDADAVKRDLVKDHARVISVLAAIDQGRII